MSSILPWILLLAPLCSAACITLFALRWKALSSFISIMAVLLSFICSCLVFARADISASQFGWIDVAGAAEAAAKKAFIATRIGDFGFMIGILMLWMATGSIVFAEITPRMSMLTSHPTFLTVVALLIFCGAVGKSAQFPLHVWLPDAMEGPTPISALIHAATMVAAGVYMLVRVAFVIQTSQTALLVIAWIGTI